MDITAAFDFTAAGDETANHATFDFQPKGFFRFVFALMKPLVARDVPKQAHNFAQFVERRSVTS
jgi:hypothetical protein